MFFLSLCFFNAETSDVANSHCSHGYLGLCSVLLCRYRFRFSGNIWSHSPHLKETLLPTLIPKNRKPEFDYMREKLEQEDRERRLVSRRIEQKKIITGPLAYFSGFEFKQRLL